MRIAFWGINSPTDYSGGRYCAWMMAEALAAKHHEVHFITNNTPVFAAEFAAFPGHDRIVVDKTPNWRDQLPTGDFDLVVIVPHMTLDDDFFIKGRQLAYQRNARLVLLNFECGNWFNEYAPVKRDLALWNNWIACCQDRCLVLSISRTGQEYAKAFYSNDWNNLSFAHSYPAINTVVADSISVPREKQIVVLTRFIDPHKSAQDTTELFCKEMAGYSVVIIVGSGTTSAFVKKAILATASQHGVKVVFKYRLSDAKKFEEISKSALMLFPSRFEGYGYPPVEAQYCNTPCIAFDLPVLREVSGKGLQYVPIGDYAAFRKAIAAQLKAQPKKTNLRQDIQHAASFERYADEMDAILGAYSATAAPKGILGNVNPGDLPIRFDSKRNELCDLLLSESISRVSIFGAGRNGQLLYALLSQCGVEIVDVFDDAADGQLGDHKVKPFDDAPHAEPIFVAMASWNRTFLATLHRLRASNNTRILLFG